MQVRPLPRIRAPAGLGRPGRVAPAPPERGAELGPWPQGVVLHSRLPWESSSQAADWESDLGATYTVTEPLRPRLGQGGAVAALHQASRRGSLAGAKGAVAGVSPARWPLPH